MDYEARVRELEAEGLTTSDAQAVADAEAMGAHDSIEGVRPPLSKAANATANAVCAAGDGCGCNPERGSTIVTDAGVVIAEQRHVELSDRVPDKVLDVETGAHINRVKGDDR